MEGFLIFASFSFMISMFVVLCFLSERAIKEQAEYLANIRAHERRAGIEKLRESINFIGDF